MMMNKKKPFSLHLDVDSFMPATTEEKEVISRMRPSSTFFRDGVKRLLKNKVATISLILIVLITLSSIIIPMFWPYSYDQMLGQTKGRPMDNSYNNLAPFQYGKTELKKIDKGESVFPHIFGTDAHGRDYFIRVVYGTRISLAVGFFASIIVLVIGMMIGAVAGYFGGRVDLFIMRIVDIIYSLPDMLVIILLSVVLGQVLHVEGTILEKIGSNIISMFIVFGLLYWVGMARLIRGQILSLREQEYVLSAQATGAKARWIIRKHLLPNCISVVIISTALQIPNAIFTESFLSFLGLGVNAPMPSLGSLASDAPAPGGVAYPLAGGEQGFFLYGETGREAGCRFPAGSGCGPVPGRGPPCSAGPGCRRRRALHIARGPSLACTAPGRPAARDTGISARTGPGQPPPAGTGSGNRQRSRPACLVAGRFRGLAPRGCR